MPTLEALLASRHQVVGVVTQPDRPRGRGQRTARRAGQGPGAVRAALPVLQPTRSRTEHSSTRSPRCAPTSAWSPHTARILPQAVLGLRASAWSTCTRRCCPGIAARHRSIAPSSPATARQASRSCVSSRRSMPGRCSRRPSAPIGADETSAEVERDARARWAPAARADGRSPDVRTGRAKRRRTRPPATYAPRLTKEDGADRLAPAGGGHPQPGPRPAPLAACVHVSGRAAAHPAAVGGRPANGVPGGAWRRSSRADGDRARSSQPGPAPCAIIELQAEGTAAHDARSSCRDIGSPRACASRHAMIAPARVAAYRHPRWRSRRGRADLPAAVATRGRDCRTIATAPWPPTSRPAFTGGAPRSTI